MAERGQNAYQDREHPIQRHDGGDTAPIGLSRRDEPSFGMAAERSGLFAGISPADCGSIFASARTRDFARGEMLYLEGYAVQEIFLLTSGFVKITQLAPSGTETILRFGAPGDGLGMIALCTNGFTARLRKPFARAGLSPGTLCNLRRLWNASRSCGRTSFEFWARTWRNSKEVS